MKTKHAPRKKASSCDNSIFNPSRWGLPAEAIETLGERLHNTWQQFHECFTTRRHDTSEYAFIYLKGIMLLPCDRNYKNIARSVISPDDDGQNLQQFMSDTPWFATDVFDRLQCEIREDHRLQGGLLTLDESGDVRSGDQSAGAAPQYIGNVGKIALGQVGVLLGYYAANVWTMVDAELFLPECWFDEAHKKLHRRLHIPSDRKFQTKLEIGLQRIDHALRNGLPFSRFSCDTLYGQSHEFRAAVHQRQIPYLADIPKDLKVYLQEPKVGVPCKGTMGRAPTRWRVLNEAAAVEVRTIVQMPETTFRPITVRFCERGWLRYPCAKRTVWTITSEGEVRRETLFMRRESDGDLTYSLSNEPVETPLKVLAQWRSERYFVERTFQDAKSEGGWDELVARKYRAWMHHTSLDALALWFAAQTKLDWKERYPPDPKLADQLNIEQLPALSMANIRLLLQAVMPLEQLSVQQATDLVVRHLVDRSAATRSRLKRQTRRPKKKQRKTAT